MLDRPAASPVDVSFTLPMERLPCRFASVDLFDETGTKRLNITLSIRKTRLSALDGSHLPDAAPEVWTDEPGEVAALAGEAGGEVGRQLSSTDGVVPVLTSFPDPAVAAARSAKGASGDAPPCVDLDESCPSWAKGGECDKNANYMHKNCAKACGVCDPGVEAPPDPPAGTVRADDACSMARPRQVPRHVRDMSATCPVGQLRRLSAGQRALPRGVRRAVPPFAGSERGALRSDHSTLTGARHGRRALVPLVAKDGAV